MTGYSAAFDDEQNQAPAVIPPQSQLFVHDCACWPYPQILALGEMCQHCGKSAGQYAPGMVLMVNGEWPKRENKYGDTSVACQGEKRPHCGHIAGEYVPSMTLVVAPFERAPEEQIWQ